MELVDERQAFPLALTGILTFFLMAATYGLFFLFGTGQSSANTLYWYIARAAGFTGYELLALAAILGVSTSSAMWDRWKARWLLTQMHQLVSLMVIPFIILHLWALHQDTSVPFLWRDFVIPFRSHYRTFATGLGVLGVYGVAILVLSSYVRKKIGVKLWRTIHYLSFPLFLLVSIHGFMSGTDSSQPWALWMYVIPCVIFTVLSIRRIRQSMKIAS